MPAPAHAGSSPQNGPPADERAVGHAAETDLLHLARFLIAADTGDAVVEPPAVGVLVATVGSLGPLGPPGRPGQPGPDDAGSPTIDLLLRPLDAHPAEALTGFVAPPEWTAIGIVGGGTSHHLPDTDHALTPPLGHRERIRFAYVVARDGASASAFRRADETTWEHSAAGLDEAAIGRIDDVLRRALGLPTHPAPVSTIELWARLWLDHLVALVAERPARRWSWPAVAVLHPAAQLVLDDLDDRRREVVDSMPHLAETLAQGRSWADLRSGYASTTWEEPAIPADVAEWMDDGIFSRWLLDGLPSCGDALVALRDLLPARLVTRIERTLDGWGLVTDVGADPWLSAQPASTQP